MHKPRAQTESTDICAHVKDSAVHIKVRWIMETKQQQQQQKTPSMHRMLGSATLSQLAFPCETTRTALSRNPSGTIQFSVCLF